MDAESVIDAPLLDIYVLFLYHIILLLFGSILRFHSKFRISYVASHFHSASAYIRFWLWYQKKTYINTI